VLLARARELVVLKDPSLRDASNAEIIEAARLILLDTTEGIGRREPVFSTTARG
jgi:hypothetical protein